MESVRRILSTQGVENLDDLDVNDGFSVKGSQNGYMDLEIEAVGVDDDMVSVAHYYTQRGDLMRDPEAVYRVEDFDGEISPDGGWIPVEYRQDGFPNVYERDEDGLGYDTVSFLQDWDGRLQEQGFVELAEQGLIERYSER